MRALLVVLVLAAMPARADSRWSVIVRPSDGEIVGTDCGPDVRDHVWRIVLKRPYIEIVDDRIAVRIAEKHPTPAQRQQLGNVARAFYDLTETRTIAFGVRWKSARGRRVPVEVSVIVHVDGAGQCQATWLGLGERI